MTYVTHYTYGNGYPRCGHPQMKNGTVHPERVTCKTCLKLMKGEAQ